MAQNTEIEFKAHVEPEALADLRRSDDLRTGAIARPITRLIRSVYFDTPDRRLQTADVSLRLRRQGGEWVQTVKLKRQRKSGLHRVDEINDQTAVGTPDLDIVSDSPVRKRVRKAVAGAELEPVFETAVRRTSRRIRLEDGSEVELAIDTGDIKAGEASTPVSEIEIELLSGAPEAVYTLARTVFARHPGLFVMTSKASRGFSLCEIGPAGDPRPRKTSRLQAVEAETSGEAFQRLAASLADAVAVNLYLTLTSDVREGPHQLRVSLGRLRCLVSAFADILDPDFAASIEREAKRLRAIVAPLRDADVLLEDVVRPAADAKPELGGLVSALEAHREARRAEVRRALLEADANPFVIDLYRGLDFGGWRPSGKKRLRRLEAPVHDVAADHLTHLWAHLADAAQGMKSQTLEQRHAMRRRVRKLRYATLMLGAPAGVQGADFTRGLSALQDTLGFLNDLTLIDQLIAISGVDERARAKLVSALRKAHGKRADAAWEAARTRWKALKKTPRWWDGTAS